MQLARVNATSTRPILRLRGIGGAQPSGRSFAPKPSPHSASSTTNAPLKLKRDCNAAQTETEATSTDPIEVPVVSADPHKAPRSATPFDWGKQWYAVAVSKDMDTSKPYPVQVLGKRLVLWVDGTGAWRCFEDRCPHRAAPLSEGKVLLDKNTIQCSYHGWQFGTQGDCVRVPQAASEDAERVACSSPKACARVYPVAEAQGMLFIWGESGPEAEAESAAKPLPVCKLLQGATERGEQVSFLIPAFHRDLPYDWSTMVENVADPAHVAFAHHGVQGNRDKVKYGDYELKLVRDPDHLVVQQKSAFGGQGYLTFEPPSVVNYITILPDGGYTSFRLHATPTAPGACRLVAVMSTNRRLPARLLFRLVRLAPSWLDHILFRHPVLDGDNVFLHYQEHAMVEDEAQKGQGWRKHYYMPTRADTLVAAFKNWLDVVGGGGPYGPLYQAPGYPPLQHDHKVLLNRYEQHTKSCKACSGALKWVERWRAVTAVVSAVGFAVAVVAGVQVWGAGGGAAAVRPLAGGVLVGLVGALVTYWLSKTREAFYFVDYVHATR